MTAAGIALIVFAGLVLAVLAYRTLEAVQTARNRRRDIPRRASRHRERRDQEERAARQQRLRVRAVR